MTTKESQDKALNELGPRYLNSTDKYTRVSKAGHRKGDNAPKGVIELRGNPIELLEKQKKKDDIESGKIFDLKKFTHKILKEEEEFIQEEKSRLQELLQSVNSKLQNCEDAWDKFELEEK